MKKQLLVAAGLALMMSACVKDKLEKPVTPSGGSDGVEVTSVTCIADDFVFADRVSTRTSLDLSQPGIKILWSGNDIIGIYPQTEDQKTGDQISFPLKDIDTENQALATVSSVGWALIKGAKYFAYYPFNRNNSLSDNGATTIQYTYAGQKAAYAEGNIVDIGDFDYMYSASAQSNDFENLTFHFNHLGALARFQITFPETATYTHLTLAADSNIFPVEGTFDLTSTSVTLSPEMTTSSIMIDLNKQMEKGSTEDVYFMLPETDCDGISSLRLRLVDNMSNEYECTLNDLSEKVSNTEGKIKGGAAYKWEVADFRLLLSKAETANCYIVSNAGNYKFKAVQGNSFKLNDQTKPGTQLDFDSVEVLWESFGTNDQPDEKDLISKVGHEDGYITFTATATKGNAVIAAKKGTDILWSWHIWMTDTPEDQTYKNGYTMMDRNLGATSATPGDVGALGLLYQWGRKDPFMGSSSITDEIQAKSTATWNSESSNTMNYAIQHPTTFLKSSEEWCTGYDVRWGSSKTIYDPCPPGYRVPHSDVWLTAFGTQSFSQGGFDSKNYGFNFGSGGNTKKLTDSETCWYPAAGRLMNASGGLVEVDNTGQYWSCSNNYFLLFWKTGFVDSKWGEHHKSYGASVRCLKVQ